MQLVIYFKPAGKILLGRLGRRWYANIIMDVKEIGLKPKGWVDSAQDGNNYIALVNATFNVRIPNAIVLVSPAGKRPLGRPRRRWEGNI